MTSRLELDGRSFRARPVGPGDPRGITLGNECGTITYRPDTTTTNQVRNLDGHATLSCAGSGHAIRGTVEFEHCH